MNEKTRKILKAVILLYTLLMVSVFAFSFIIGQNLHGDEQWHYRQVWFFLNGRWFLHGTITMIPGYHFIMFLLGYLFNTNLLSHIRIFSFFFSFLTVVIFYLMAEKTNEKNSVIKTVQYFVMPIIFPFFFLVYTDIFSMLFLFIALFCTLSKKYTAAGIWGIISLFSRQNNVIWLAFLFCIIYVMEFGYSFERKKIITHLKKRWIFLLGFLLIVLFVIFNKGFTLGDRGSHPIALHTGNVFLMLFLFFFLFLPLNVSNFKKIVIFLKENKTYFLYIAFFFVFYLLTYKNDHPYNNYTGIDDPFYFNLRTRLLVFSCSGLWQKVLYFIPAAYAALSIRVTKLSDKSFYLLWPFTVLYLAPSWLIEQRYYMLTYSFFILFKEEESPLVEYSTIVLYVLLTIFLFDGIVKWQFFL